MKDHLLSEFIVMEFVLPMYDCGWLAGRFVLRFRAVKKVLTVLN